MNIETIEDFAISQGFNKIKKSEDWRGYNIYTPVYEKLSIVGFPYFIMVKGEEIRMSTLEETWEYMS